MRIKNPVQIFPSPQIKRPAVIRLLSALSLLHGYQKAWPLDKINGSKVPLAHFSQGPQGLN